MVSAMIQVAGEVQDLGGASLDAKTAALTLFGIELDEPAVGLPVGSHGSLPQHHHVREVLFPVCVDYISGVRELQYPLCRINRHRARGIVLIAMPSDGRRGGDRSVFVGSQPAQKGDWLEFRRLCEIRACPLFALYQTMLRAICAALHENGPVSGVASPAVDMYTGVPYTRIVKVRVFSTSRYEKEVRRLPAESEQAALQLAIAADPRRIPWFPELAAPRRSGGHARVQARAAVRG
jgi:hypothetical protein